MDLQAACIEIGIQCRDVPADGKFHPVPVTGKPQTNSSGRIKLFPDGKGGVLLNHVTGERLLFWFDDAPARLSAEERERRATVAAEQARQIEEERALCRLASQRELANTQTPPEEQPYLLKKGVLPCGVRWQQQGNRLLIPVCDFAGVVHGLQYIDATGEKRFKPGTAKAGHFFTIAGSATIVVCEGFATGASVHQATGATVLVAFDAGNLLAVTKAAREHHPESKIIIAADDDHSTPGNPGLTKATAAAQAVNGLLAVPLFAGDREPKQTDFNDLHQVAGLDLVREIFEAATPPADKADGVTQSDAILAPCPLPEKPSQAEPEAPEKSERELLAELAKMTPLQYDRCREEYASILGVRAATLDKEVMALRKDGKNTKGRRFAPEDQEPWPDPIMQPDGLLHEIDRTFRRFIVCQPEARRAAVLWVAYTWFIDVVQVAPVGLITAPERACGKTQMLSLMARLSYRPLPPASSISASSLFRLIEDYQTTLFLDECDNQLRDNPDMLLLLNSGHTRESAQVIRSEAIGDEFVPCRFSTWGAKALSGISQNHGSGKLHETLLSRSIPIEMRRKLPHETVDRIRNAEPGLFDDLRSKLARFADDYRDKVRHARPPLPEALSDRQQDNWEPLLQVAMVAGGDWLQIGIEAALKISGSEDGTKSIGEELLADIQEVFESQKIDRISTVDLLKSLCADDERPWSTYNRGLPIKPRQLASKLAGYGIHSKNVKINFGVLKGFTLDQFAEAFKRYIPVGGEISVHPLTNTINNNNIDCLTVAESEKQNATKTLPATERLYGDDIEQLLPDLDLSVR
jgi:putative DNA primase/helicase